MDTTGRWRSSLGATSAEMIGVVVIVAAVIAAVWALAIDDEVAERGAAAVCSLFDPECADDVAARGEGRPEGGDRPGGGAGGDASEDEERGGRAGEEDDRREPGRDGRRGEGDDDPDDPDPDAGTPGPEPTAAGLGDPVVGTDADEPAPPAWQPPDPGAGEHDSEDPSIGARLRREAVEAAAQLFGLNYENAGANLLHFLGNSGADREQDVDDLLTDVPEFAEHVEVRVDDLALLALEQAQAAGVDEPVTFPVSTPWVGYGYEAGGWAYENRDWQLALGGWQSALTGTVTVYPPSEPGGAWRTETTTTVHLRDQYNWDAGKETNIAGLPISDADLAELHRMGLAQEYLNTGRSQPTTRRQDHP